MSLPPVDAIKDPIYGYIEINSIERKIIDNPIFQRLRYVYQLQIAYFTYPSAVHTRFAHSLGVMNVAGYFSSHLIDTYISAYDEDDFLREASAVGFSFKSAKEAMDILKQSVKLAALIHDIGHGPFSHAFDGAVFKSIIITRNRDGGVLVTTEHDLKATEIPDDSPIISLNHEVWGFIITFASDLFDQVETRIRDLALLLFAPVFSKKSEADLFVEFLRRFAEGWRRDWLDKYGRYLNNEEFRFKLPLIYTLRLIYRSFPWCADIIDYVLRDSYFAGTMEYGWVDWQRLIKYSRLEKGEVKGQSRIYVTIDSRARDAILNFLLARYFMYSAVYLHRTTRRHENILKKLIVMIEKTFKLKQSIVEALRGDRDKLLSFVYGLWVTVYTDVSFLSNSEFLAWSRIREAINNKDEETLGDMIRILFYTYTLRQRTRIYSFLKEIDFYFQSKSDIPEIQRLSFVPLETYYGPELNAKIVVPIPSRTKRRALAELSKMLAYRLKGQIEPEEIDRENPPAILTDFLNYAKYKAMYLLGDKKDEFINTTINTVINVLNRELEPVMVDITHIDIIPSGLTDETGTIYMYDPTVKGSKNIQERKLEEIVPTRQFRRMRLRIYVLTHILERYEDGIDMLIKRMMDTIKEALKTSKISELEETM